MKLIVSLRDGESTGEELGIASKVSVGRDAASDIRTSSSGVSRPRTCRNTSCKRKGIRSRLALEKRYILLNGTAIATEELVLWNERDILEIGTWQIDCEELTNPQGSGELSRKGASRQSKECNVRIFDPGVSRSTQQPRRYLADGSSKIWGVPTELS